MSNSESVMDTAVMDEPEVVAVADASPQSTQSGLEALRQLSQLDDRRDRGELCHLAMRHARKEDTPVDEGFAILADCSATYEDLVAEIAQAEKILAAEEASGRERADSESLAQFHIDAAAAHSALLQNVDVIRFLMVLAEAQLRQLRIAIPIRHARSQKIASEAATAAADLNGIDCTLYGVDTPVRTPAVIQSPGSVRRHVEWMPASFLGDIVRLADALCTDGDGGQLPSVAPLEAPPEMIEVLHKREAAKQRSEETASENLEPSIETAAGIVPGDLNDEFDDDEHLIDD